MNLYRQICRSVLSLCRQLTTKPIAVTTLSQQQWRCYRPLPSCNLIGWVSQADSRCWNYRMIDHCPGGSALGWSGWYNFFKHTVPPPPDAFLTLITMSSSKFTFPEKKLPPRPHLCSKNNMGGQKIKMWKLYYINEVLRDAKWWRIPNLAS